MTSIIQTQNVFTEFVNVSFTVSYSLCLWIGRLQSLQLLQSRLEPSGIYRVFIE